MNNLKRTRSQLNFALKDKSPSQYTASEVQEWLAANIPAAFGKIDEDLDGEFFTQFDWNQFEMMNEKVWHLSSTRLVQFFCLFNRNKPFSNAEVQQRPNSQVSAPPDTAPSTVGEKRYDYLEGIVYGRARIIDGTEESINFLQDPWNYMPTLHSKLRPLPIPITLVSSEFGKFVSDCEDCRVEQATREFVHSHLIPKMSLCYSVETERRDVINALLSKYLGLHTTPHVIPSTPQFTADGSIMIDNFLIANVEVKNENANGDPWRQNIAHYHQLVSSSKYSEFQHLSYFPCLMINVIGASIAVGGCVTFQGNATFSPLSPAYHLIYTRAFDTPQLFALERNLQAIKNLITGLKNHYAGLKGTPPKNFRNEVFPQTIQTEGKLMKLDSMGIRFSELSLAWKAKLEGKDVVIKHSRNSYGKELHIKLALADLAPHLFYSEMTNTHNGLKCKWIISVMDALPSTNYIDFWSLFFKESEDRTELLKSIRSVSDNAIANLKRLQELLRQEKLVHGDLRPPNIFIGKAKGDVKVIDFDWGGKEGIAQYPPEISTTFTNIHGLRLDKTTFDGIGPNMKLNPNVDECLINLYIRKLAPLSQMASDQEFQAIGNIVSDYGNL